MTFNPSKRTSSQSLNILKIIYAKRWRFHSATAYVTIFADFWYHQWYFSQKNHQVQSRFWKRVFSLVCGPESRLQIQPTVRGWLSHHGLTARDDCWFWSIEQSQMRVMRPMVKFIVISFGILDVSRILR